MDLNEMNADFTTIRKNQGFSLIEVMVAIAIISIGLLAIGSLQLSTVRGNASGDRNTQVSIQAETRLEQLMQLSFGDPSLDPAGNPFQVVNGPYQETWDVTDIDFDSDSTIDAKQVDLTVRYTGPSPQSITINNIIPRP
jgi:type IV pilus assembly protein PilV